MKEKWLECTISPGQFSEEFAVKGQLFNGELFSLFAAAEDVKFDIPPTPEKSVEGLLRIVPLEQKDELLQVVVPQETFENGQIVTVKATKVHSSKG